MNTLIKLIHLISRWFIMKKKPAKSSRRDDLEEQILVEYDEDRAAEKEPIPQVTNKEVKKKYKNQVLFPILDNGHGEYSSGKRSPRLENGFVFFEYIFNRLVVKYMIAKFKELGIQYHNLVPETKTGNGLGIRMGRVKQLIRNNNIPKGMTPIYISIHANAASGEWTNASGLETWFQNGNTESYELAKIFQDNLVKTLGWKDRGLKSKKGMKEFYVLRKNPILAILIEHGFYNNKAEMALLRKKEVQMKIADANVYSFLEANERMLK